MKIAQERLQEKPTLKDAQTKMITMTPRLISQMGGLATANTVRQPNRPPIRIPTA